MNFNIIVTSGFKKQAKRIAKKHRSLKTDIESLIDTLEKNPLQGEPLGKDCYKIRMAISSKGKGKLGGSRIITCVKVTKENIYLLSIFDKSERQSVNDNELDELLKLAGLQVSGC